MKQPVHVAITGAAGQIGYQLAFRIASGQMLGEDQAVLRAALGAGPVRGFGDRRPSLTELFRDVVSEGTS